MIVAGLLCVLATAAATTAAVLGKTRGPQWLHFLGKPLIVPPLLATSFWLPSLLPPNAHVALAAALTLAWVGDIALMLGRRAFMLGLLSFLVAHVAWLVCFGLESQSPWSQLG